MNHEKLFSGKNPSKFSSTKSPKPGNSILFMKIKSICVLMLFYTRLRYKDFRKSFVRKIFKLDSWSPGEGFFPIRTIK